MSHESLMHKELLNRYFVVGETGVINKSYVIKIYNISKFKGDFLFLVSFHLEPNI